MVKINMEAIKYLSDQILISTKGISVSLNLSNDMSACVWHGDFKKKKNKVYVCWGGGLLHSPSKAGTHYLDRDSLEFRDLPAFASQVLAATSSGIKRS